MATTPVQFNANAVIQAAFLDLGVFQPGETPPASDSQFALSQLNNLLSAMALSPLTFPFVEREVFDVVADQGTYTIGPNGDFDTIRPTSLIGAGLLMPSQSATTGAIEISRAVITTDMYEAIPAKDLQNAMWTTVYYKPTYDDGFGRVILWPVPNVTTYQCVLYRGDQIQGFTNLTTNGDYPPGLFEALQYSLGRRMAPRYGGTGWTSELEDLRRDAVFVFKRNNFKLTDLVLDPAMTRAPQGGYNINTGDYS